MLPKITVRIVPKTKKANAYAEASCPFCMLSQSIDVLGFEESAKLLAVQAIERHIKSQHADRLTSNGAE